MKNSEKIVKNIISPRINYSQDICFCMEENCPIKGYCYRAIGAKPGIHSYAQLGTECNHLNVYKMFLQADQQTISEYKEKQKRRKENATCNLR